MRRKGTLGRLGQWRPARHNGALDVGLKFPKDKSALDSKSGAGAGKRNHNTSTHWVARGNSSDELERWNSGLLRDAARDWLVVVGFFLVGLLFGSSTGGRRRS